MVGARRNRQADFVLQRATVVKEDFAFFTMVEVVVAAAVVRGRALTMLCVCVYHVYHGAAMQ